MARALNPEEFQRDFSRTYQEIKKLIVGHDETVKHLLFCLFSGGHALIEGPPGLGKTFLVKTLSQVLELDFSRVQFTPDLMPSDILGTNIVLEGEDGRRHFQFQKGPLFSQIVLADEINRSTPKTQSAMLEAMQERQVTLSGETHALDDHFFVVATRNPFETLGTYPLPAAQIDRFLLALRLETPNLKHLQEIVHRTTNDQKVAVQAVLSTQRITEMKEQVRMVMVSEEAEDHAIKLVLATHPESELSSQRVTQFVHYGSSPRGVQALILAAKVEALLEGADTVARSHLRSALVPALRHRIYLNYEGKASGVSPDDLISAETARLTG